MSHAAWMAQADSDLAAAKVLSGTGHHSQAVWLAGQAVEKGHKAILAALGLRYQERHYKQLGHNTLEISELLPEALHDPVNPDLAKKLSTLELRAFESRYPGPEKTKGEAKASPLVAPTSRIKDSGQDIADAEELLAWCRDRVARALLAGKAMGPPPTSGT